MTDFVSWRKHVDYVVSQRGRWFGLGDGDGNPLMDLPEPTECTAPDQWGDVPDLAVTFPACSPSGDILPVVDLLVLSSLSKFDPSGQLPVADEDYTLLAAFPGTGGAVVRRGGVISHVTANDSNNDGIPNEVTINALNLSDVWRTIPAVSWPASWWAARPYPKSSDESGIPYSKEWLMARVETATHSTFTYKTGPAGFVIRRLAQESLDAVMMTQVDPDGTRWVDDQFHVVEVPEVDNTPNIALRAEDGMLWDTVIGQAQNSGVLLKARLYWPGDPPVRCWSPVTSSTPPAKVDISPSQGIPARTLEFRSFTHPMVVLEVKGV